MEDSKLMIKKWAAALNEFVRKTNTDFLNDPKAALNVLQPGKYRAFEAVFQSYLEDCGVHGCLGECEVSRFSVYTQGLFSGRKELAIVTEIVYGHLNNTPKGTIKDCWLMSTADDKTAVGILARMTDGPDRYRYLIAGKKKEENWDIPHEAWEDYCKKSGPFIDTSIMIYFTLLNFLRPDLCPANPAKLKEGRIS